MMQPVFPTYASAEQAAAWRCFSCCEPLRAESIRDDGHAPGRGRYAIACDECGLSTWFDLRETAQESP